MSFAWPVSCRTDSWGNCLYIYLLALYCENSDWNSFRKHTPFSVLMRAAPLNLEYSVCLHTCTWDFNNSSLWLQGLELRENIKFIILLQDKLVGVVVNVFFSWNICAEQTSLKVNVGWNSTIGVPWSICTKPLSLQNILPAASLGLSAVLKQVIFLLVSYPSFALLVKSLELHFLRRFLITLTCNFGAEVL